MNTLVCGRANYTIIIVPVSSVFEKLIFCVCLQNNTFPWYTRDMDKTKLLTLINREGVMIWDSLCETYPTLVAYDPPKFKLNPYTWRTAGMCFQDLNLVELGYKFFKSNTKNFDYMMQVILPHEIIHQADFNLHGESEKKCGHGAQWCKMMLQYGLPADKFHPMEISRK